MNSDDGMGRAMCTFQHKRDDFVKNNYGKFVVISFDSEVYGFYKKERDAYFAGIRQYGRGQFMLQKCIPLDEEEKVVFHSRVW